MKKILVTALVLAAIVAVILFFGSRLDGIVAGLIEDQGSAATQTPVRVGGVSLALKDASGTISRLTIGNPDGFSGNAIEMEGFSIRIDPATLTSDTIVINDVTVSGATLNILQSGADNNLRMLLDNLKRARPAPADDEEAGGKKVIIDRFTLDGATAYVNVPDLDEERRIELPEIVVRDIGRASNGATGAQVARQILDPVVERALRSAAAQSVREKVGDKVNEVTQDVLKGLGDALGGSEDEDEAPR